MDAPVRKFYLIDELFDMARQNPRNPMNEPGRFMGKHALARKLRAQAKRTKGRVVHGKRHREGRMVFDPQ